MKAMQALLWKEFREVLPYIFLGVVVCVALPLLRLYAKFEAHFASELETWAMFVGLISALLLGVDRVNGERTRKTLDFLLGRPVSIGKLQLAKFATGGVVLFFIIAGFWGTVYLFPLGGFLENFPGTVIHELNEFHFKISNIVESLNILNDVGYIPQVVIWFTPMFLFYAGVFLFSTLTSHPIQGAIMGVFLTFMTVLLVWEGIGGSPVLKFGAVHFLGNVWNSEVTIVRLLRDGELFFGRLLTTGILGAGLFGIAVFSMRRLKEVALGWRSVFISCIVGSAVLYGIPHYQPGIPHEEDLTLPTGTWMRGEPPKMEQPGKIPVVRSPFPFNQPVQKEENILQDLVIQESFAFVATGTGLSVVDISEPDGFREIGSAQIPQWHSEHVAVAGTTAYLLGYFKSASEDSVGIAIFDISNPGNPELRARKGIAARRGISVLGYMGVVNSALYVGLQKSREGVQEGVEILSYEIGDGEELVCLDSLKIEQPPLSSPHYDEWRYEQVVHVNSEITKKRIEFFLPYRGTHVFQIDIQGQYAFLGMRQGLVIVDLGDPADLQVMSITGVEPVKEHVMNKSYFGRRIAVEGQRAYMLRYWPRELVVLDISDPRKPVEVDYIPWSDRSSLEIMGKDIYQNDNLLVMRDGESEMVLGVSVFELGALGLAGERRLLVKEKRGWEYENVIGTYENHPIVAGDFVYTLLGGELVAFPRVN